jgi:hypothetical protein
MQEKIFNFKAAALLRRILYFLAPTALSGSNSIFYHTVDDFKDPAFNFGCSLSLKYPNC